MLVAATPPSVLYVPGATPVLMACLAHVPDTKPLRVGVWTIGLTAFTWTVLGIDIDPGW
jgi:hypothetical protein